MFDFAVIGGGPSGALCAILLARAGSRTLLVSRPKPTSAIELLSGRAQRLLKSICPALSIEGITVHETVSLWSGSAPLVSNSIVSPWGAALAIERSTLDPCLRRAAEKEGVTVMRALVRHASVDRIWRIAEIDAKAAHLIVATGRGRSRLIERASSWSRPQVMFYRRHEGTTDSRLLIERADRSWWHALPHPRGGCSVGLCTRLRADDEVAARGVWPDRVRRTELLRSVGAPMSRLSGRSATVEAFSCVAGDRWTAVGDAAFSCDPLSGEGLMFAALSASRAAATLLGQTPPRAYAEWIGDCAADHIRQRAQFT